MNQFEPKALCILGRQPGFGLAELESLYGADHVQPIAGAALLDIPAEEINFKRLGGTIKVARVLMELPDTDWRSVEKFLHTKVPEHLANVPEGKFTLGLSIYGLQVPVKNLNASLLELKKLIRRSGRPVRIVPNKTLELSSAQVLHNGLTRRGAWELLLVRDVQRTIVAQTLFVQDIEAYAARDQARPKRDARVGMLPPKLAQIIINLVAGPAEQKIAADKTLSPARIRLLDPFCGTGVMLQEAMLMGYSVMGSDIDPRMVDYTRENLSWLVEKYPQLESQVAVEVADATSHKWPGFSVVASEVFLGRPLNSLPDADKLREIINDADTVTKKFLKNLALQMKSGQIACLALPAWRGAGGKAIDLPVLAKLTDMGYNYLDLKHVRRDQLLYFRVDQVVARRLIRIEKK